MKNLQQRGHLLTEQVNPYSQNLDQLSSLELVDLFNQEDNRTLEAIASSRLQLSQAVDITTESLSQGGRLFYVGATRAKKELHIVHKTEGQYEYEPIFFYERQTAQAV